MTDKLTLWFSGEAKPARNGVYETDPHGYKTRSFQHWDGEFWGIACTSPCDAARVGHRKTRSFFQNDKWRGFSSNPKRFDMTNKMHSVTWSADGVLTIDSVGDCVEVQPAEHDSELEILNAVVNRMSTILANISLILNGTEPALQRHSYHDLAEKVAILQIEVDLYRHHAALPVRPAPESKAMTDTRDAFEAECRRYWGDRCPDLEFKNDKYESGRAEIAYAFWQAATLAVQPAQRNFCERCGQRLGDAADIHTCTPPESKA